MSEQEKLKNMTLHVPALAYDGGNIYVPMALHDEAVQWLTRHMGWNVQHQFDNRPSGEGNAIIRERKTILGFGSCVQSLELRDGADPLLTAVTEESRVRWCWRTRNLAEARAYLQQAGALVGDPYIGPGGHVYFDFWATQEKILLTAQEDADVTADSPRFVPSWNRIGVGSLSAAQRWYEAFVGMRLLEDHSDAGYLLMGLNLEHHPDENSLWILEQQTGETSRQTLNGAARPNCVLHDKRQFADYHAALRREGIIVSDILGHPPIEGFSWFHFYDQDGNRFDVYRY